ncbi:MAG: valine--tRNA ligase [Nitrospirales bacterium]|nr:valine--tRNA ligase [Nitrospirales bacterium]
MTQPQLEKVYEPQEVEKRWGAFWINQGYQKASPTHSGTPYTIVIPPPNVTGSLHIGHALNNTLQDILIRWRRMQGNNVLWLPGTDHAGIATQNVVERQLLADGQSREHVGREKFIQRVWEWKQQSGDTILGQLRQLGASCDWDHLRFTMDEGLSTAVREVFVRLYEEGLIYRGKRLINWCPRCLTALSDVEVEHESVTGDLYHIRYSLIDEVDTSLIVATTRPETMLGDTAVAVHPEDPRYNHLIGKQVHLPLTSRTIPIIGDSILVDREFGTGAVKITPAHDFNDFEAGERHGLAQLSLFDHSAHLDPTLLNEALVDQRLQKTIAHKPVLEARQLVVDHLKEQERLLNIEDHAMALGKCYRCKTVVEPYLSPQWFVKIQPLADPAIQAVENDTIRIIPEGWKNNYLGWMRNIKDWCISRQIWWGHQIPAWYCQTCNKDSLLQSSHAVGVTVEDHPLPERTKANCFILSDAKPLVSRTAPTACPHCKGSDFYQDPDVLDTWFSSALWPFSTLGWPEQTQDFKTFYPTATLVTGLDILFFWVARMIMMGLKFTGQVPFRDVYIHALVRDAEGQKMSKSKGNVIDPLTKMSQYGTDALRYTLAAMASPGRDIKLAEERIEGYRNFANKIWNAGRFILMHANGPVTMTPVQERTFADRWIYSRLNHLIRSVNASLEDYRFDQATSHLYHFLWHEYCDWYLELIKPTLQADEYPDTPSTRHTLLTTFEILQRLLHPFMPFLTEEIWQVLPHEGTSIMVQAYPQAQAEWDSPQDEEAFELLEQFVTTARTGRSLLDYAPSKPITLYGIAEDPTETNILRQHQAYLAHLSKSTLQIGSQKQWTSAQTLRLAVGGTTVGIMVEGHVDLKKALDRIRKQIQTKQKEATRLQGRLASPDFTAKALPDVIQESKNRLQRLNQELTLLASSDQQLQEMGIA